METNRSVSNIHFEVGGLSTLYLPKKWFEFLSSVVVRIWTCSCLAVSSSSASCDG